jgi:hypothetical protein
MLAGVSVYCVLQCVCRSEGVFLPLEERQCPASTLFLFRSFVISAAAKPTVIWLEYLPAGADLARQRCVHIWSLDLAALWVGRLASQGSISPRAPSPLPALLT